ncbi:outer membrane protein assembly factor BamE [Asticcacaulis endophyticus]|jgi:outer membrane protein assembly factor BamE (lipoprotein component of BamABCDE complex)|uniref:outer membrane protein assembly factor BamE n=1 Tax=Asticcacaulis endophyticus TaxID=1395890 RepID=UPI00167B155F|nr:outer membrane protein assembly factor BamE [Asticcacaulis endophyticus]
MITFKRLIPFVALAGIMAGTLTACAPTISRQGYLVSDVDPSKDIKVGEDTQTSVRTKLGSPSLTASFEPGIWYYIDQTSRKMTYKKSEVTNRKVTVIEFDKSSQVVKEVKTLTLADGRAVDFNQAKTPTRGRELTALEQILGNVGRQTITNEEDSNPGGQRRRE